MSLSVTAAAREAPKTIALVAGDASLTYRELAERVVEAAERLISLIGPAERGPAVALTVEPTVESIVRLLACLEAGVAPVLLPSHLPAAERARIVTRIPGCEEIGATGSGRRHVPLPPTPADDGRPAVAVLTSGTGGLPRAALLSRRALVASAAASAAVLGWRDPDRWLLALPPARVGGLSVITRSLIARRTVVLPEADGAAGWISALERRDVTLASLVPAQLERVLGSPPSRRAPAGLRAVLVGGAAAPARTTRDAVRLGWPVLRTYGMTECCSQVATQRPDEPFEESTGLLPLPGVDVRVVDGTIEVRGETLMSGYLPAGAGGSPFGAGGWFRTSDRGEIDAAGRLTVLGRADDVIVSGGEKIDPRAVEGALLEHPSVASALVFPVPDAALGNAAAAAVVFVPGASPVSGEIAAYLMARLSRSKCPRSWAVVEALPLTPDGKPDRRGAARRLAGRLVPFPAVTEREDRLPSGG